MTSFLDDSSATPQTPYFGLTRVGSGESLDKNGWAFSDLDRLTIDAILYALAHHTHSGSDALAGPTDPPDLTVVTSGGDLPPATDYYYRVAYIDGRGLETEAGPEGTITTPDPVIDPNSAPALTVVGGGDGSVEMGQFSYIYTFGDITGGQTLGSDDGQVTVDTPNAQIIVDLPDLIAGAINYNIYRARPGQDQYYYLATTTSSTYFDRGMYEDQSIVAPVENTTSSSNAVIVGAPGGFLPPGTAGWRIYRAPDSGAYAGDSLVHEVVETSSPTTTDIVITWTDDQQNLAQGIPHETSNTIPDPAVGSAGSTTGTGAGGPVCVSLVTIGDVTAGRVCSIFNMPTGVDAHPIFVEAFFNTPPSGGGVARLDLVGNNGETRSLHTNPGEDNPSGYYSQSYATGAALTLPITVVAFVGELATAGSGLQMRVWI